MIRKIVLNNYKCFNKDKEIELAPFTILCGTNSSGKSSILKSILMMKQTTESKSPDPAVVLSGQLVDNGTFDDVVFVDDKGRCDSFSIEHDFEVHNHTLKKTGKYIKRQDAKAFNELRRVYSTVSGEIEKFVLRLKIVTCKQENDNEFSQYITDNYVKKYSIYVSAFTPDGEKIQECNSYFEFENKDKQDSHFLSWKNIPGFSGAAQEWSGYSCTCSFNGLVITSVFAYNMPNAVKSILPNIMTIVRIAFAQYEGINFIAPLRHTPERTYLIKGNVNSVGISGENTPTLLAKIKNQKLSNDFPFMGNSKRVHKNYYFEIIQYWLTYFGIGKLAVKGKNGAISIALGEHNISDVGFGISQVLPIITQGICMSKEETLIIEQPEIHLHPKMELDMADYLLELAKSERNLIVETHSDHIINRIIHRVMENYEELNALVKIYFIENSTEGAIIHPPIEIDKFKGTKNIYKNFFTQYTSESKDIVNTGLENMLRSIQ